MPLVTVHWQLAGVIVCLFFHSAMSRQMNVLFAVFDDLRPQLGVYNHTEVLSPNINMLAASPESTLFTRAYTNYACE